MDQFEIHFRKKYYEFYSGSSLAFEVCQGLDFFNFQKLKRYDFRKKNMYRMHQGTLLLVKITLF